MVVVLCETRSAQPIQYVKICSLYGAGFYYIPGTDFCLKLGGWVRTEYNIDRWRLVLAVILSGGDARYTRELNDNTLAYPLHPHGRRAQSDRIRHAAVHLYIASGVTNPATANNAPPTLSSHNNRAFIQWAGFTMGLASSFFDFFQFSGCRTRPTSSVPPIPVVTA